MEVSKTNDRNKPITMQRKVDYTKQAIVKYSMNWKHEDYKQLGSKDQVGRYCEANQNKQSLSEDKI